MRSLLPPTHIAAFPSLATATSKATKNAAFLLLFISVLPASGVAAVPGQAALDGFDPNANGTVRVVVVQPDGRILIGGDFTTLSPNGGVAVTRNHIARLNPDGTLDAGFDPNANGNVLSIALQADGKILAGGAFAGTNSIGGQTRNYIARLDATTGVADSFNPSANNQVLSIAVQADGKILAGGAFAGTDSIGGQTRNNIARLDPITGLADSFDPNASDFVRAIALQADGKILAAGFFFSIGGQSRRRIARLDATTGLADSFNPNANAVVLSIAVQADGKVLAGGNFNGATSIGGQTRNFIARLDATTGLADSFDPNANDGVESIAVQADGKILAGGFFTVIGNQTRNRIARLDATTGLADSFDPNANGQVLAIAVQADGKILAGGFFNGANSIGGQTRNRIARLENDGRLDQTLDLGIVITAGSKVVATAVQPDGKILIGGAFSTVLGVTRNNIARLNTDGTLDTTFNPNANGEVLAIVVQADGKILAGGRFFGMNSIGGRTRSAIARLDATTGLADSFDPNANESVYAIAVQADGKILAGGNFSTIGGQMRNRIARLDATTGLADSFNPNASNTVYAITVQADGRILAGGGFSNIGGQPRRYIARLDATTGLADSFDPIANGSVYAIAVQADGKILAGGFFQGANSIGGQLRNRIARLDATTGLADSFDPNASSTVDAIAVQADGRILVGGGFTTIGIQTRNHFAQLDATTGVADSFNPDANGVVNSIAVQADGKILVGGVFTISGGETRSLFARLISDTAALQNLAATRTAITWTRGGSSPQFTRVTFESSTDNVNYTSLGNGIPQSGGSNWILTGLSLSTGQNISIRARGYYGDDNGSGSIMESVRNAFLTPAAQAINLSTRMRVQTGDNVGIGGVIITGTASKHVLLRAIGPSLTGLGVPGALADPVLELHGLDAFVTITNDNWRDDPVQEAQIQATGLAPANNFESAIDTTLDPGAYTAIVGGKNNTSGVALVEVYDLSQAVPAKLANISTRAFVSTGNNIVIAGFILGSHSGDDRIVVRGIGPSLTAAGVPNALPDPTLELRDGNGMLLVANNDWQDNLAQAAELTAAGLAPPSPREPAIAITLPPGPYTALLAGLNNGTGVGLVEVYDRGGP